MTCYIHCIQNLIPILNNVQLTKYVKKYSALLNLEMVQALL